MLVAAKGRGLAIANLAAEAGAGQIETQKVLADLGDIWEVKVTGFGDGVDTWKSEGVE